MLIYNQHVCSLDSMQIVKKAKVEPRLSPITLFLKTSRSSNIAQWASWHVFANNEVYLDKTKNIIVSYLYKIQESQANCHVYS